MICISEALKADAVVTVAMNTFSIKYLLLYQQENTKLG